jgi:hypothetical protein
VTRGGGFGEAWCEAAGELFNSTMAGDAVADEAWRDGEGVVCAVGASFDRVVASFGTT